MSEPLVYNGQVWEQKDFPYCRVMILMLGWVDNRLMFCRTSANDQLSSPLVECDADGKWMYTADEILERHRKLRYTECGVGHLMVVRTDGEP